MAILSRQDSSRSQIVGSAVILSGALYRPLLIWSSNVHDIGLPWKVLFIGISLAVIGLAVAHFATRLGVDWSASAIGVGLVELLASHWKALAGIAWLVLAAGLVFVALIHRLNASLISRIALAVWLAVFALAPVADLLIALSTETDEYPITVQPASGGAHPTGLVEDLVIVVVDGHPSLSWVASHTRLNPRALKDYLEAMGFTVPWESWSQHTDTSLAIPSLMSLTPVISGAPVAWGNRASLLRLSGGDNYVVSTAQSAGFQYTHIESGWHLSRCGAQVETCVAGTWLDEEVWQLVGQSVIGDVLTRSTGYWNVSGALHASEALQSTLARTGNNDRHDLIFAHILLPHSPYLVDSSCQIVPSLVNTYLGDPKQRPSPNSATRAGQLECVANIIKEIAAATTPTTAVVFVADHGSNSQGQTAKPARSWSDPQIAERMSAFLAYKLPSECEPPQDAINVLAIRAAMSCTVVSHLPSWRSGHFVGIDQEGAWVESDRMAQIRFKAELDDN